MSIELVVGLGVGAIGAFVSEIIRRVKRDQGRKVLEISAAGEMTEVIGVPRSASPDDILAAVEYSLQFDQTVHKILTDMVKRGTVDKVERGHAADFRVMAGGHVFAVEAKAKPEYMNASDVVKYLKHERGVEKLLFVCADKPPRHVTKGLSNFVEKHKIEVVFPSSEVSLARAIGAAIRRPVSSS